MRHTKPSILALPLLLAACGPNAIDAPSLQPRPIERQSLDLPDTASEPETPVPSALSTQLQGLVAKAEAAHAAFEQERGRTEAIVLRSKAAPEGSDAWVGAQAATSALETAQGPLRDVAAAIDDLRQDPANYGTGARAAIDAAAARVEELSAMDAAAAKAIGSR